MKTFPSQLPPDMQPALQSIIHTIRRAIDPEKIILFDPTGSAADRVEAG